MSVPEELNSLRTELEAVDAGLLELGDKRQALASAIGEAKRELGLPTRDFTQEREVLERARRTAQAQGIPGDLGVELLRLLIASSLTRQEQDRLAASAGGVGRRALIIGGSGRMGGWLLRFLGSQGFAIEIADPAPGPPGIPRIADWRGSPPGHGNRGGRRHAGGVGPYPGRAGRPPASPAGAGVRRRLPQGAAPGRPDGAPAGRGPGHLAPPDVRARHRAALRPPRHLRGLRRAGGGTRGAGALRPNHGAAGRNDGGPARPADRLRARPLPRD